VTPFSDVGGDWVNQIANSIPFFPDFKLYIYLSSQLPHCFLTLLALTLHTNPISLVQEMCTCAGEYKLKELGFYFLPQLVRTLIYDIHLWLGNYFLLSRHWLLSNFNSFRPFWAFSIRWFFLAFISLVGVKFGSIMLFLQPIILTLFHMARGRYAPVVTKGTSSKIVFRSKVRKLRCPSSRIFF